MNKTIIFLTITLLVDLSLQQENGFLLATYKDRINRIDPLTGRVDTIFYAKEHANDKNASIKAVDFDAKHKCLFFESNFTIIKKCLEGNLSENVIADNINSVDIFYDSGSELLYIYSENKIETVKIIHDEHQPNILNHMRRILNDSIEFGITDIAVDPENKFLFFITYRPSSIWRSYLDGSEAKLILNNSVLTVPLVSIDFDSSSNHIYWAEVKGSTIGSYDLNGGAVDIRVLKFWPFAQVPETEVDVGIEAGKIAVTKSRVFFYDVPSKLIIVVDKDNDTADFFCDRNHLNDLKFISTTTQLSTNYCSIQDCDCSHVCIEDPRHGESFASLFEGDFNELSSGFCNCKKSGKTKKSNLNGLCARNVSDKHLPSGVMCLATLLAFISLKRTFV